MLRYRSAPILLPWCSSLVMSLVIHCLTADDDDVMIVDLDRDRHRHAHGYGYGYNILIITRLTFHN